ncbi:ATP-binding response regulator [Halalkalibacter okhensis]|uniref:histidine kinase n=1 Tax=Halalkalibacter okhensis TaxID=333138 RepID=A0A0B0IE94_9BACI|nr:response regulator [Halalkalibacter okhensis]KHF40868.1 histidine kinase [Halalkalibacter okhensis]
MSAHDKVAILMVDDRPENLMALEAVLDSEQYLLIGVRSGEEALKKVLLYDFAVILLDVQMPGLNGFETAEIIKQRKSSSHIPIIFITALSKANEHVSTGYLTGAIDYIFKPFNPIILRSKVDAFAQIHRKQKEIEQQNSHLEKTSIELQEKHNNLENLINEKTKELVQANEELQVSQERFQKIFQHSPNLMAIRSLVDQRYVDVNQSWLQFSGYEYKELATLGNDVLRIHSNSVVIHSPKGQPEDLQNGVYNKEITYVTKQGEKREGLLSTETATIDGEPCIISTITDITEIVDLEREVTRLDRLNLVGEMAAGIAHEIRNPMTTVLGFLQLAKNQSQHPQPEEYINLMIDELHRANGIITEFLTLAKDKANNRKKKDLNEVVTTLHPLLRAEALMNNKVVILDLKQCPMLFLDEKEIRQLILNIGLNGLEAMESGGRLTLKTYTRDDYVILEIADTGPGIKKEVLENIGTPFFTTKDEGTGLGLAICYSIASRHFANIDIKTSGNGTSFIISFQQNTVENHQVTNRLS